MQYPYHAYINYFKFNYEIRDYFYNVFTMRILHKSMLLLGFIGTSTNVWTTIVIPLCTNNTSNQFFYQCKMHMNYI